VTIFTQIELMIDIRYFDADQQLEASVKVRHQPRTAKTTLLRFKGDTYLEETLSQRPRGILGKQDPEVDMSCK
jgi:hypothetical protein